jgi:hypothetical protein
MLSAREAVSAYYQEKESGERHPHCKYERSLLHGVQADVRTGR